MAQWHRTVCLEAYERLGLRKVQDGLGKENGEVMHWSLLPLARAPVQEALSPCTYRFVSAYVSCIPHCFNASVATGIYQNGK